MNATATFQTEQARRHMATLCKHFARKVTAHHDDHAGHVEFPFGYCDFAANSRGLTLTATAADSKQLNTLIEVISRHLERFAFRENPELEWHPGPD